MFLKALTGQLTFTSIIPPDLSSCTKQYLKDYFENGYDVYESLFATLRDDKALCSYPNHLRHQLLFYYTHTAAVFINKLVLSGLTDERVDHNMETIFEIGVDEMTWDDMVADHLGDMIEWPSVDACVDYRRKVRAFILRLIDTTPLDLPITQSSQWWAMVMGMEHERVHTDTSIMLLRQLPVQFLSKPNIWSYAPLSHGEPVRDNPMIEVKGREVTFGKPQDYPTFGWDIEYGQKTCYVPSFEASTYLVTNRQFMEFVTADGYSREELWTTEGWGWRSHMGAIHPAFWVCDKGCRSMNTGGLAGFSHCTTDLSLNGSGATVTHSTASPYRLRVLYDVLAMPWDWPVEVNYHELSAFCRWKGPGFRPAIEAEMHLMRDPVETGTLGPHTDISFQGGCANTNLVYASPSPVTLFPPSALGFHDVQGNVWQWLADHMNGLPGYRPHYLYDDHTTPFMDGQHLLTVGGSWSDCGVYGSQFTRSGYRKHFEICGFRLVRSITPTDSEGRDVSARLPVCVITAPLYVLHRGYERGESEWAWCSVGEEKSMNHQFKYENDHTLTRRLHKEYQCGVSYCASLVQMVVSLSHLYHTVLHVGCGTGAVAFELTQYFHKVVGIDFCARFISACLALQSKGQFTFPNKHQQPITIELQEGVVPNKVVFKQLVNLPNDINGHDVVLVTCLDRMTTPEAVLARLWEIVTPEGVVIIVSKKRWPHSDIKLIVTHRLELIKSFTDRNLGQVSMWKRPTKLQNLAHPTVSASY